MSDEAVKFCKDCRWAKRKLHSWPSYNLSICTNPQAKIVRASAYLVDGQAGAPFAENERNFGNCGPSGKLFEPKRGRHD